MAPNFHTVEPPVIPGRFIPADWFARVEDRGNGGRRGGSDAGGDLAVPLEFDHEHLNRLAGFVDVGVRLVWRVHTQPVRFALLPVVGHEDLARWIHHVGNAVCQCDQRAPVVVPVLRQGLVGLDDRLPHLHVLVLELRFTPTGSRWLKCGGADSGDK